jgi:hypothetical protein
MRSGEYKTGGGVWDEALEGFLYSDGHQFRSETDVDQPENWDDMSDSQAQRAFLGSLGFSRWSRAQADGKYLP